MNLKKVLILKPDYRSNDLIKILKDLPIDIDWFDDFELEVKIVENKIIYMGPYKGRISRIIFRGEVDHILDRKSNNEPLIFNYNKKSFCISYT